MIVCVAEMIVGGTFLIFAMRKGAKKELKELIEKYKMNPNTMQ